MHVEYLMNCTTDTEKLNHTNDAFHGDTSLYLVSLYTLQCLLFYNRAIILSLGYQYTVVADCVGDDGDVEHSS